MSLFCFLISSNSYLVIDFCKVMQPVIIGVRFLQCGDYSMSFYDLKASFCLSFLFTGCQGEKFSKLLVRIYIVLMFFDCNSELDIVYFIMDCFENLFCFLGNGVRDLDGGVASVACVKWRDYGVFVAWVARLSY